MKESVDPESVDPFMSFFSLSFFFQLLRFDGSTTMRATTSMAQCEPAQRPVINGEPLLQCAYSKPILGSLSAARRHRRGGRAALLLLRVTVLLRVFDAEVRSGQVRPVTVYYSGSP
jgi:hypothetical protein